MIATIAIDIHKPHLINSQSGYLTSHWLRELNIFKKLKTERYTPIATCI